MEPGKQGLTTLDARYTFRLRSGANLYVQSSGTRYGQDAEAVSLLVQGRAEEVVPAEERIYFRLRLTMESDDPDLDGPVQTACRSLVIATAVRGGCSVLYDAYRVL